MRTLLPKPEARIGATVRDSLSKGDNMSEAAKPVERVQIVDSEETVAVICNKLAPTWESESGKSTMLASTKGKFVPCGKLPNGSDLQVQFTFRVARPAAPRADLGITFK